MKKLSIYILLVFYIAVQLRPLTAVLQDVVAHTFFKMQHMATVHYENGRYHIHKELKAINDDESGKAAQKGPSSQKTNEFPPNQVIHELSFNFKTHYILIPAAINQPAGLHAGFSRIFSPPPQQA